MHAPAWQPAARLTLTSLGSIISLPGSVMALANLEKMMGSVGTGRSCKQNGTGNSREDSGEPGPRGRRNAVRGAPAPCSGRRSSCLGGNKGGGAR